MRSGKQRNPFWMSDFPLWVSRRDTDGRIYRLTVNGWLALLLFALVVVNALVWGVLGLVAAVQVVF